MSVVLVLGGLVLLAVASEQFVLGAMRVATALRVSILVIGVVVVGFGTSVPEALVSGLAAARGDLDVGAGNIIGSNAANLSLVLGVGALVRPLAVRSVTVWREAPIALLSAVLFTALVQAGLSRIEGLLLLLAMGAAVVAVFAGARDDEMLEREVGEAADTAHPHSLKVETTRLVLGLAGTLAGAELLLRGALDIAEALDLAGGFVGLTLVALGTSLPELVTVVQAVRHEEPDLVVGNLLGSSTFNALFVAGTMAMVGPGGVTDRDLTIVGPAFMVALTAAVWVLMRTGLEVRRWEGGLLLAVYVAFVAGIA